MGEDMEAQINDVLSQLGVGAVGLHEMFTSFVEGRFTENQALTLIAKCIAESGKGSDDNG